MAAPVAPPNEPGKPTPPPPAGSALVRQLALLGVLVVLLGMLGYDLLVLGPAAEKADKELEAKVSEKNQAGIKPGAEGASRDRDEHLVTSNDIHKWLGTPTKKLNKGFYTLEYYNHWGVIPIPRQYICVVYQTGKNGAPDLYASHHRNREPEEQDLPRDPAKVPPPATNPNPPAEPGAGRNIPGTRPSGDGTEGTEKPEPSDKPAEPTEPGEKTEKPATPEKTEPADPPAEKTPATEGDEK